MFVSVNTGGLGNFLLQLTL